jgi:hypothetical protein
MKRTAILIAALAVIGCIFYWWVYVKPSPQGETGGLGSYAYECDEHVAFVMTPSSDLSTISIKPSNSSYPPASTLKRQVTNNGARYEGNGVVFVAHGEGVVLGEGDSAVNCSPIESSTEAPFNFGD